MMDPELSEEAQRGAIMAILRDLRADVAELKEAQRADDLERAAETRARDVYRWISSALIAILVAVSSYFFATAQNHEARIKTLEGDVKALDSSLERHEGLRGHQGGLDETSELAQRLSGLASAVSESTEASREANKALSQRMESLERYLRRQ